MQIDVGVERVDAVLLRGDDDDVVGAAVDGDVRDVERLGEDGTIHLKTGFEESELPRIDSVRSQHRLVQVLTGAPPVIVVGQDAWTRILRPMDSDPSPGRWPGERWEFWDWTDAILNSGPDALKS